MNGSCIDERDESLWVETYEEVVKGKKSTKADATQVAEAGEDGSKKTEKAAKDIPADGYMKKRDSRDTKRTASGSSDEGIKKVLTTSGEDTGRRKLSTADATQVAEAEKSGLRRTDDHIKRTEASMKNHQTQREDSPQKRIMKDGTDLIRDEPDRKRTLPTIQLEGNKKPYSEVPPHRNRASIIRNDNESPRREGTVREENARNDPNAQIWCDICSMWLNGAAQYEDHLIGRMHGKNV